jgi:ParB-like chromosome segregation protein Spo0J
MFNKEQSENKIREPSHVVESTTVTKLQINKEYENLIPPMTKEAFESLMSSIRESGQLEPITINNKGEVLDGHHRLRVCEKLHIEPLFEVKAFDNPSHEKLYIIDVNLQRRQLTVAQRVQLSLKKKPILQELTKKNSQTNLRRGNNTGYANVQICTLGRVNEKIAKDSGVSARQVSKVETILEKARPELKERVLSGTTKIDKAYKQIINEERRLKLIAQTKSAQDNFSSTSNRIKLLHGDMRKLAHDAELIPDNSIDLIFTDPLYHREYLPLYVNLAEVADRVLKDGGSLVTYIGQYALPKTLDYLRQPKTRLRYRHEFCIKLEGPQFGRLGNPVVLVKWKPLLWFVKGEKPQLPFHDDFIEDMIESKKPDKSLNKFAQSAVEAEYIISKLTIEDMQILDPFLGGGTTAIAAANLNRRFIGIDISAEAIEYVRANLSRHDLEP